MAGTVSASREASNARKQADAAWDRYTSAVAYGGTLEERAFAYDQARRFEDRAVLLEQASG